MMGCWRWHLHTMGRLPWTHTVIGWVTGNKDELGQRKIEKWEKLWWSGEVMVVICGKSRCAAKALQVNPAWMEQSSGWRFCVMKERNHMDKYKERFVEISLLHKDIVWVPETKPVDNCLYFGFPFPDTHYFAYSLLVKMQAKSLWTWGQ